MCLELIHNPKIEKNPTLENLDFIRGNRGVVLFLGAWIERCDTDYFSNVMQYDQMKPSVG